MKETIYFNRKYKFDRRINLSATNLIFVTKGRIQRIYFCPPFQEHKLVHLVHNF